MVDSVSTFQQSAGKVALKSLRKYFGIGSTVADFKLDFVAYFAVWVLGLKKQTMKRLRLESWDRSTFPVVLVY